MIKVTNGQVWKSLDGFKELLRIGLPIQTTFKVKRLYQEITSIADILNELRNGLITKYGETDGEKGPYLKAETVGWRAFSTDFNTLLAETLELKSDPITIKCKEDSSFFLSTEAMFSLDQFIIFEIEE